MSYAVHHIAVVVGDLAKAEHFYVDTLGLRVLQRWNDDKGEPRSLWCELDNGAFLAVETAADSVSVKADKSPGWHMLALAIQPSDRVALAKRLTDAGHPVVRETAFTFYVRDPDGNLVGFSSYPQKSA